MAYIDTKGWGQNSKGGSMESNFMLMSRGFDFGAHYLYILHLHHRSPLELATSHHPQQPLELYQKMNFQSFGFQ